MRQRHTFAMAFVDFPSLPILIGHINQSVDNPINNLYIATEIVSIQVMPRQMGGSKLVSPIVSLVYDASVIFEVRKMTPAEVEMAFRESRPAPTPDPHAAGLIIPLQETPSALM